MNNEEEKLIILAERSLSGSEFKYCKKAIINNNTTLVLEYSKRNLKEAKDEVLKSVYQQNCDMAVFAHYRASVDFNEAVIKYKEKE